MQLTFQTKDQVDYFICLFRCCAQCLGLSKCIVNTWSVSAFTGKCSKDYDRGIKGELCKCMPLDQFPLRQRIESWGARSSCHSWQPPGTQRLAAWWSRTCLHCQGSMSIYPVSLLAVHESVGRYLFQTSLFSFVEWQMIHVALFVTSTCYSVNSYNCHWPWKTGWVLTVQNYVIPLKGNLEAS